MHIRSYTQSIQCLRWVVQSEQQHSDHQIIKLLRLGLSSSCPTHATTLLNAGKPKEAQARSCHQEVIRQSKAALAGSSSATRAGSLLDDGVPVVHKTRELSSDAAVAANGYLAAAELCLLLDLPLLAGQLLEAAAGAAAAVAAIVDQRSVFLVPWLLFVLES